MCRYQDLTRAAHVCLECEISLKATIGQPNRCPNCQQLLLYAGPDFAAPRRGNHAQWRKVARLLARGVTFSSCGCNGPGWRPRTLGELNAWERDADRAALLPAQDPKSTAERATRQDLQEAAAATGSPRPTARRPDGVRRARRGR